MWFSGSGEGGLEAELQVKEIVCIYVLTVKGACGFAGCYDAWDIPVCKFMAVREGLPPWGNENMQAEGCICLINTVFSSPNRSLQTQWQTHDMTEHVPHQLLYSPVGR